MIYLATRVECLLISEKEYYIHEFYLNGLFYSYETKYVSSKYRVCGIYGDYSDHIACETFEYELPDMLNIVEYYTHENRMKILEQIVEQKIYDDISIEKLQDYDI